MRRLARAIAAAAVLGAPGPAQGLVWDALWLNDDQRGAEKMRREDYQGAAETFDDRHWRATALYRAGEYRRAAEVWARIDDTRAHYNRGNALARAGELGAAMAAYRKVLARDPGHEDARYNLALLSELARTQQQADGGSRQSRRSPGARSQDVSTDIYRDGSQRVGRYEYRDRQAMNRSEGSPHASGDRALRERPLEEHAAMEQWLRRIPDDSGGLLRRKFLYQYERRSREDEGKVEPW